MDTKNIFLALSSIPKTCFFSNCHFPSVNYWINICYSDKKMFDKKSTLAKHKLDVGWTRKQTKQIKIFHFIR